MTPVDSFVRVTDYWDVLCNQCIQILENLSHQTGLSYGLINVLFFCILGPLSTLCFMGSTATTIFVKTRTVRRNLTVAFKIAGLLCIFTIILRVLQNYPI